MKTVIFDFDGTIVDNYKYVHRIIANIAPTYGFSTSMANNIDGLRDMSMKDIVSKYHISRFNVLRMLFDSRREMKKYLKEAKMPEGMKELLESLGEKGVKIAIISSNSKDSIQQFLEKSDVTVNIDVDSSIHLFGKAKPILKYLRKNNIDIKDAIYVGDEVRDIDAAKEAGIEIVSVTWGYNNPEVLKENNQLVATTSKELAAIIDKSFK